MVDDPQIGEQGAASTIRPAPPRKAISGRSSPAALGTLIFSAMSSRKSSVVAPRV